MKYRLLGMACIWLATTTSYAANSGAVIPIGQYPALNIIHYQTSVEQWVTTKTALVTIGVDASLNQMGMDSLQQQVNNSLKTLAENVSWQMTDYERSQDSSGLEQVHIEEQTRLTSDQLINLRSQTDKLSKPGIKYTIIDIQFTPSLADIQAAQDNLRSQLYSKIAQEIKLANKIYDQAFYVHDLEFYSGNTPPVLPGPNQNNYKMMAVAMPAQPSATMSQKLVMGVDVTLAATISNPD